MSAARPCLRGLCLATRGPGALRVNPVARILPSAVISRRPNRQSYSSSASAISQALERQTSTSVEINGRFVTPDSWFNVPPNVIDATSRRLHLQQDHPVAITRQIIESVFPPPIFKYHNSFHPVVSTYQNFDSLGFPADHPGRNRSDTYYVNKDTLLRTHTTAHELEIFSANQSDGWLMSADVYRRDAVDRTHFPAFHQMDAARVWDRSKVPNGDVPAAVYADLERLPEHNIKVEDPNPPFHEESNPRQTTHSAAEAEAIGAHLKRSLELMVVEIFSRAKAAAAAADPNYADEPLRVRWVEAYFPFTSPSWELEVYYAGDWLEVLGCGVTKHDIHVAAGNPSQLGWAFGIGLERIAMLLFQIPDIRLFWSKDPRFLGQFDGVSADLSKLRRFVPFSRHPECYKDVSFWLGGTSSSAAGGNTANARDFHENDLMEVVRGIAGDTVEDVRLTDEFTHPRTGRRSLCYRINYRSLERTLTNAETNDLHARVTEELIRRLGVEIR
jgi:phenylalanyl-tRNA synthetase alpha chain